MKRAFSYILAGVVVIAVIVYLVYFFAIDTKQRHELVCSDVNVMVADSVNSRFITSKDVEACIQLEYGECRGMLVEEIDLTKIEDILRAKNAVLRAEAFFTPDGVLNVKVNQRIPVLRFKNDKDDFYADSDGYIFHMQTGGAVPVMTIGGHFPINIEAGFQGNMTEEADREWIVDMLAFSKALKRAGMSDDVSVSILEDGDIVLLPADGHPQFVFGSPDNFSDKFGRMKDYYSAIVPEEGADTYSTVILKYADQIVCRK